jgi:hypothetical protein
MSDRMHEVPIERSQEIMNALRDIEIKTNEPSSTIEQLITRNDAIREIANRALNGRYQLRT